MVVSAMIGLRDAEQAARFEAVLLPRAPYEARYTAACGIIGFAFESQSGTHCFGSDRRTPFRARPNSLAFIPPGCDVYSRSPDGGEYLLIRIGQWRLPGVDRFNDRLLPGTLEAACQIRCELLRAQARPAQAGRAQAGVIAELSAALEAPVHALLTAVTRSTNPRSGRDVCSEPDSDSVPGADSAAAPDPGRWMTTRRLRLIDELIEAQMATGVSVGELARALGLSLGFFIRAFRRGAGRAPHDYIMERRLSRARILLVGSSMSLTDIATACGFASHAHMCTVFRARLHLSPSALRAAGWAQ